MSRTSTTRYGLSMSLTVIQSDLCGGISKEHKCCFLPTKDNEPLVNDFRDHALAQIRDIEDLGKLGKKLGVCPYYASRATIKPSEVSRMVQPHTQWRCLS